MNWSNRASDEKRGFIRMKLDAMVSYTIEGKQERYEGRCKNISGAGLLLETNKKITQGTRLNITIPSENPNIENLNATVEVIRSTPIPDQHKYELGVAIRQIR